ncbi:MAG: DoxX family protein [Bdellovibrionota bacterium]
MKRFLNFPDLGILIFRLVIGLTMGLAHGLGKMPPPEQLTAGLIAMGFPQAVFFAWCAALSEFLGGLLIAAGLFTRHAAVFLGITMAVAVFMAHAADPFGKKELAVLYLASCVLLFFQGAGKFSMDRIFRKK